MSVLPEAALLFRLEVVVGAVVVDDLVISLAKFQAVLIDARLYVVALFRQKGQGSVHLMDVSPRLLDEAFRVLERGQLGARIKNPRVEQHLKYLVKVILVLMLLLQLLANLV